ncbi:MAG: hypothetical protein Q8O51_00025 [bacterium]|nr:hypothetical protein [bacterium]
MGIIIACQRHAPTAVQPQINTPATASATTLLIAGASYSDLHRNAVLIPRGDADSGAYLFDIRIDGSHQFQAVVSLTAFQQFAEALDLQQIENAGALKETSCLPNTRAIPGTTWKHRTLDAWITIRGAEGDVFTCDIRINGSSQLLPIKAHIDAIQQTVSMTFFTDLWAENSVQ